jgi:protein TonB
MKFITFLVLSLLIGLSPTLMASEGAAKIQKEADQVKSKEGRISFGYVEKLLELTRAYQQEKNFKKATSLDQEVTFILKTFLDSLPEDYELETLLLEQEFTRWQGLMRQEQYDVAQQLILDKDWIKRSIKIKQYLNIINLFQVAHETISSGHENYLANWEAVYALYTNVSHYNLQQTQNLWKTISLHRIKETKEESPEHLEVLFGYASFSNRTNDTKTYETLKTTIEKHWPFAFRNENSPKSTLVTTNKVEKDPKASSKKEEEPNTYAIVGVLPRFPGCEVLEGDHQKKKNCADQRFIQWVYTQIRYPRMAVENGISGTAIVSFTITEYGTIIDCETVRDPGGGCGQEALRIVQSMNELPRRWTAGSETLTAEGERGKDVRLKYNLPISFKLN